MILHIWTISLTELIGYIATTGVAAFMLLSSNIRYRWYSFAAALAVSIYGFAILDPLVGGLNFLLAAIGFIVIMKIHSKREYLRLFEVDQDSKYLRAFIEHYHKEINRIIPYYTYNPDSRTISCVFLRNMVAVGVFIAKKVDSQIIQVELDFIVPEFRDYKMGKHVYNHNQQFFYKQGFRWFHIVSLNKEYDKYLQKMGFREDNSTGQRIFIKEIKGI